MSFISVTLVATDSEIMMGFTTDESIATELETYIVNDGTLYRQRVTPIITNLAKKMAKGTYNRTQAVKLWRYLADDGAKKYNKEFGLGSRGYGPWTPAIRNIVAKELRDYYEEQVEDEAADIKAKRKKNPTRRRNKGHDWIQGVDREIEEDGTEGAFTKQARRAGYKNTMEFARKVMAGWDSGRKKVWNKREQRYQNITLRTMRRANFAINVQKNPSRKRGKEISSYYEKCDDALTRKLRSQVLKQLKSKSISPGVSNVRSDNQKAQFSDKGVAIIHFTVRGEPIELSFHVAGVSDDKGTSWDGTKFHRPYYGDIFVWTSLRQGAKSIDRDAPPTLSQYVKVDVYNYNGTTDDSALGDKYLRALPSKLTRKWFTKGRSNPARRKNSRAPRKGDRVYVESPSYGKPFYGTISGTMVSTGEWRGGPPKGTKLYLIGRSPTSGASWYTKDQFRATKSKSRASSKVYVSFTEHRERFYAVAPDMRTAQKWESAWDTHGSKSRVSISASKPRNATEIPMYGDPSVYSNPSRRKNASKALRKRLPKKVEIEGKRWRDRNGNTYHRAYIYFDDELVYRSPVTYGYGREYADGTAKEWLVENRWMPSKPWHLTPYGYFDRDKGIQYKESHKDYRNRRSL